MMLHVHRRQALHLRLRRGLTRRRKHDLQGSSELLFLENPIQAFVTRISTFLFTVLPSVHYTTNRIRLLETPWGKRLLLFLDIGLRMDTGLSGEMLAFFEI
jgi:hypothetical protein